MRVVITHGHIFKNAGTSFDWALRRNFGKRFCDHRHDEPMRKQGSSYLVKFLQESPELVAISSHHMCNISEIDEFDIVPVYFLRHPIERALSVYNFEKKQQADTPGAKAAKKYSFKDYVQWRMEPGVGGTIRNYQTAYISGFRRGWTKTKPGFSDLQSAVEKINNTKCIGIVDRFDESMVIIEKYLRKFFNNLDLSYIKQNEGKKVFERALSGTSKLNYISEQLGATFDDLLDANYLDMVLYKICKEKLEKQISQFEEFSVRLQEYRERCRNLDR